MKANALYWNSLSARYQQETHISCDDFHYGPLLPGDRVMKLLPESLSGMRCLEAGCGAAQNSIYLARRGAHCTAIDVSSEQLAHASELASEYRVELDLQELALEKLDRMPTGKFDLVHSVFALPFVSDPEPILIEMIRCLRRPGGILLLATGHPLAAAEWLLLEEGEDGIFMPDYYHPPFDHRRSSGGGDTCARAWPLEKLTEPICNSGAMIKRLLEPQALPVGKMNRKEIIKSVPYWSDAWLQEASRLQRMPAALIILAEN